MSGSKPPASIQLSLFPPPDFDELLERRGVSKTLRVEVNPRLKRSWKVIGHPLRRRTLEIPASLFSAPEEVKQALIDWTLLPLRKTRRWTAEMRNRRSALERIVWHHLETSGKMTPRASRFVAERYAEATRGCKYDLREVFDSVNARCFGNRLDAVVRWGSKRSRTSYHIVKKDRQGKRFDLITIAGLYDRPDIPRFAIEGIMHHEMLHIAIPPYERNGRMVIHGSEFKAAERRFGAYGRWRKWEMSHFGRVRRRRRWFGL